MWLQVVVGPMLEATIPKLLDGSMTIDPIVGPSFASEVEMAVDFE
jgi:hypothetical protein